MLRRGDIAPAGSGSSGWHGNKATEGGCGIVVTLGAASRLATVGPRWGRLSASTDLRHVRPAQHAQKAALWALPELCDAGQERDAPQPTSLAVTVPVPHSDSGKTVTAYNFQPECQASHRDCRSFRTQIGPVIDKTFRVLVVR